MMQNRDKAGANTSSLAASLQQSLALPRAAPTGSLALMDALRAAAAAQKAPAEVQEDVDLLVARGLTCAVLRMDDLALQCLQDAARAGPMPASAWRELALLRRRIGDVAGAEDAVRRADTSVDAAAVDAAAVEVAAGEVAALPAQAARARAQAERKLRDMLRRAAPQKPDTVLRGHLIANPRDASALYLLAGYAATAEDEVQAERLLARVLELAPDYADAREDYATVLLHLGKGARMLPHLDLLLAAKPNDDTLLRMRATALELMGDNAGAVAALERISVGPGAREGIFWISYGRCLQFAGRPGDSVRAYRSAIARRPQFGEAYWGITNLKSERLTAVDMADIHRHLANPATPVEDRIHFHYALGFALEQASEHAESFTHYAAGAALRSVKLRAAGLNYDPAEMTQQTRRHRAYFNAARLARHAPDAALEATPIFVLGMPRSGSTLVEQILSSHSMIEGTQELPEIAHIARGLGNSDTDPAGFPACLDRFSAEGLAALGQEYLRRAAMYRRTSRPYFIDKMPANWTNIGLIHLILPQAKIIDTRREAMGCCFSGFKQLIAKGAEYSCELSSLGHFYRQYEGLVSHYDAMLPGRIHRVTYETMVADTEAEVTRLLAYCGVPFEAACLRFWETRRAVATPSAEQVRRPIFRDALSQWRKYEPWLGELRAALAE
jgi:tetratricopeptide (TPR) repeat protein